MRQRVQCPVCSSHATEFYLEIRGFSIVRCKPCDTAFHPAQPSVQHLREFYSDRYFTSGGFESYPDYLKDEPVHRKQAQYHLDQIRKLGIRPGHVLDVGCAAGFFLDEARRAGWATSGCDISDYATRHARDVLKLDVRPVSLLETDFAPASFDVITLFSVMAHLPQPHDVAARLHSLLKPGGYVLLETSNRDAVVPRLFGRHWHLWSPPSVLFFYNRASLQRVFAENKWRLVRFSPTWKWISLRHGLSRLEGRTSFPFLARMFHALRASPFSKINLPYALADIWLVALQKL
jgi:SAM-dependent methyltransferase